MNMLELLAIILPIIALFCVLLIALVNVFIAIRKYFPIKANCWFCNKYTQVKYDYKNSFYCASCHQYNGFNNAGDYNKLIPEQHNENLNNPPSIRTTHIPQKASNGLCRLCNNNQRLKVQQLSAFVPLNDSTFDIEIEHFTSLLERAYKLCPKCDQILHHTLSEQNNQLIGQRILSMHKRSMDKSSKRVGNQHTKVFLNIFLYFTLILISTLILIELIQNTHIKRLLPVALHSRISGVTKTIYHAVIDNHAVREMYITANRTFTPVKLMVKDFLSVNLTSVIALMPRVVLNRVGESFYEIVLTVCGLFLHFCTFLFGKCDIYATVLWIFLLIISYIPFDPNHAAILKIVVIFLVIYKTLKNAPLKSNDKTKTDCTKHLIDATASFSLSDSSAINSTNYFNTSDTNLHGLKSTKRNIIEPPKSTFGCKAVLKNPLFKLHTDTSFLNKTSAESLISFKSVQNTEMDTRDIQRDFANLSFGTISRCPTISNVFRAKSPDFVFDNKFWRTDNWLKQNSMLFSSRCSSQTSGFVSVVNDFSSSSSSLYSATSSMSGDSDRFSVVSQPQLINTNFRSSVLRLRANVNRPTASNFREPSKRNSSFTNGNTIGLFKPIVFNSAIQT